jgi:hypothetical protein
MSQRVYVDAFKKKITKEIVGRLENAKARLRTALELGDIYLDKQVVSELNTAINKVTSICGKK